MDTNRIFIAISIIVLVLIVITLSVRVNKDNFTSPTKKEGESCQVHTDCIGWGPGNDDMACCNGICTRKVVDWAGIGYCPSECRGGPGELPGTCDNSPDLVDGSGGSALGQTCQVHTDCEGWGPDPNDVACCQGKCTRKLKDWAGVGYCPHECRGSPDGAPGSCGQYSMREVGESCSVHTDCKGWGPKANDIACCDGVCAPKKPDWAGVGYCPSDCRGSPGSRPGTC